MRSVLLALTILAVTISWATGSALAADWETVDTPNDVKIFDMGIEGGTIWLSTHGEGLAGYDGSTWVTHKTEDGGIRKDNWNYRVYVDSGGCKWITRDGELTIDRVDDNGTFANKTDDTWSYYSYPADLANKRVFSAAEDLSGRVWFGMRDENHSRTGTLELSIDHGDTVEWLHYDNAWTPDSTHFSDDDVRALVVDHDGRLWIGYNAAGIDVWDYRDPRVFADDTWIHYDDENGLPDAYIHTLAVGTDGRVWVGALGGLGVFNPSSGTWTTVEGLPGTQVRALAEDAQGHMWVGTDDGMAMLYGNLGVAFTYDESDGLADGRIDHVVADKTNGDVWAVSVDELVDDTTLNLLRSGITADAGRLFVYPNPWREGESAQMVQIYGAPEGSRVEILDLSGQRMAELEPNEPYVWDSLDAAFDEVPSGVYILRIVLPNGNVEFLKVAIIR